MDNKPDISVIVCTYKPDWKKLKPTIKQISAQRNIQLQLIITDDGSEEPLFEQVREYLEKLEISDYVHVSLMENEGTIRNVLNGLKYATADYVYLTSPGDLLFDELVLSEMIAFMKNNHIDNCFGKAAGYSYNQREVICNGIVNRPMAPQYYEIGKDAKQAMLSFLLGNEILGAVYIRKREDCIKNLEIAKECVKYSEDTMGTAIGLLSGQRIYYCPRIMVWYEQGFGISTSGDNKWRNILRAEYGLLYEGLSNQNRLGVEKYLKWIKCSSYPKHKRWVRRIMNHPIISARLFVAEFIRRNEKITDADINRLREIVKDSGY